MPVIRQLVGVESPVRIDGAAGEGLAHQPEQGHRAGGVGDTKCVGRLGGVGLADVGEIGEQVMLRHAQVGHL